MSAGLHLQDELSPWESAAAPLWGTFTGHSEGEWLGQYSAYTPWGGAVALLDLNLQAVAKTLHFTLPHEGLQPPSGS